MIYIYELYDPRNPELAWYVGVSTNPIERYRRHLTDKRYSVKYAWVQSLLSNGIKPGMRIVDNSSGLAWINIEKCLIEFWKHFNPKLLNLSIGGEGHAVAHTPETKLKISESRKGISAWNKGLLGTQVAWNKGKHNHLSKDTINKMSIAKLGKKRGPYKMRVA